MANRLRITDKPFRDKFTQCPHNDLEHYQVKGTQFMFYWYSRVISLRFCSTINDFQYIFEIFHFSLCFFKLLFFFFLAKT